MSSNFHIQAYKATKPYEPNRNMMHDLNYTMTPLKIKPQPHTNINKPLGKKISVVEDMERLKQRREERKKKLEEKNEAKIEASNEAGVTKVDADYENLISLKKNTIDKRQTQKHTRSDNAKIFVCVRKRPISNKELQVGEIDCVSALNPRLLIHECKIKIDGITKYIEDHEFFFDNVFSENEATQDLYTFSVEPTINLIMNRGIVTCFAYGQTGSGKTYTMKGIQNLAIDSIFHHAKKSKQPFDFFISFYEIYAGRLYDLLNNKNKLSVLEDKNQKVQIYGLEEKYVTNADEMREVIELANSIRTTHNTVTNETSSRSHAICNIVIKEKESEETYGKLTLVDLAGSERAQETQSNEKSRRAEGAEINKSLLALKECIRALDSRKNGNSDTHVPFRASKLTLVLRDSFIPKYDKAKIIMIACIAPDLTSTNHTLNTLRYSDRLKEKTSSIKNTSTISSTSQMMNKMLVNPLTNSTSDNSNLKLKNYLFDINMNDDKNLKSQSKDFPILKTNSKLNIKNLIYEEIEEDKVQKLDVELINKSTVKNDSTILSKKGDLTRNNTKKSKLSTANPDKSSKNITNSKPLLKVTQPVTQYNQVASQSSQLNQTSQINKSKKSPEKKRMSENREPLLEERFITHETNKQYTKEEETLIESHMDIIKNDAKFLTEEGDLITNLKGIGPDNDIQMDEYVKVLERIIDKKLNIYNDLKKKMEACKKPLKKRK